MLAEHKDFCMVTDIWSETGNKYIGYGVGYIDKNWERMLLYIGCQHVNRSLVGQALGEGGFL